MSIKLLSQEVTMLNDNFVLEQSEDRNGILHLADAGSLRKRDAIIDRMEDGCEGVFLRMRDAGSERVGNESETFSRDSRMNDELFDEVEDDFSGRCNDVVDISCVRVCVCCKNDSEEGEIVMRISLSGVEDEDIRMIEFEGESERNYLCSNCGCGFS